MHIKANIRFQTLKPTCIGELQINKMQLHLYVMVIGFVDERLSIN